MELSSSSSKVAALANIFQSNDDSSQVNNNASGGTSSETPKGGIKYFKNSVQIRRTSSQVARFSSAKKIFEMKDKETALNQSHSESPVSRTTPVMSPMSSTLPQKLIMSGSKIPIGEFWKDKKDKTKLSQGKTIRNDDVNKENVKNNKKNKKVKSKPVPKYEALVKDVGSPTIECESEFSGLLDNMFSPEFRKAEYEFEEISSANISNDNILDETGNTSADNLIDKIVPLIVVQDEGAQESKETDDDEVDNRKAVEINEVNNDDESKKKRLQSTPKDSRTKGQERDSNDLTTTREEFQGFEISTEVLLDGPNATNINSTVGSCPGPGYNASSLGSSLEGRSSWLATTTDTNTTDDETLNDKDKNSRNNVTLLQENVESSDYVSGDSCDIISPQPATTISKDDHKADEESSADDVKVHFLEDGHFWYEGSPLEIIEEEEMLETSESSDNKAYKVRFSTSPIRHFSTFSNDEYDRRNDDVDPAAATAVYELEKRLEKMKMMTVELSKEGEGLGISVLGIGVGPGHDNNDKLGIFIKSIVAGGAADRDGTLQVGDQIVSVDDDSLVGVTQEEAGVLLRNSKDKVKMVVARNPFPSPDQVMELIKQCTDTEADSQDDQDDLDLTTTTDSKNLLGLDLESAKDVDDEKLVMRKEEVLLAVNEEDKDETSSPVEQEETLSAKDSSVLHVDELFDNAEEEKARETETKGKSVIVHPQQDDPCNVESKPEEILEMNPGSGCCGYKAKYETLMEKHVKTEETLRQVNKNLTLVTQQMMSREKMMQSYMETVSQLCNLDSKAEAGHELLNNLLELRQQLIRTPYIPPAPELDLPESDFDKITGETQVLDSAPAKDKIRLFRRSLSYRRTKSKYSKTQTMKLSSTTPANLELFFRRNLLRSSLPVNLQRSASCSESDGLSSASSIHSNESLDKINSGKKKSRSLLKQMKRRMSFTNHKGY